MHHSKLALLQGRFEVLPRERRDFVIPRESSEIRGSRVEFTPSELERYQLDIGAICIHDLVEKYFWVNSDTSPELYIVKNSLLRVTDGYGVSLLPGDTLLEMVRPPVHMMTDDNESPILAATA